MQLPDPRFRCTYLVNKDEVIFDIKQEAIEEAESVVPLPVCTIADDDDVTSQESQPPPKKKLKGLAAVLVHTLSTPSEELTIDEKVTREMRRYEEYPVVSMEADLLIWWKSEAKNYPSLAPLVKKYLCICSTSVASERLFSKAGFIANAHRNHLSSEHVLFLLFLSKNLQS